MSQARLQAVKALEQIITNQQTLSQVIPKYFNNLTPQDKSFAKQLSFGVMRQFFVIQNQLKSLLKKPLKRKDNDILAVIYLGIYQMFWLKTPDHAAISESVVLTRTLKKPWADKLVNAILRKLQRSKFDPNYTNYYLDSHPDWIKNIIKKDWPNDWENILQQNQQQALMTIRVNQQKTNTISYLEQLQSCDIAANAHPECSSAITLESAVPVTDLPNFANGWASVQDASAQNVAHLLAPYLKSNQTISLLDSCAAPGGKTCHVLEINPELKVTALDKSSKRLDKIKNNLKRLDLTATLINGDASLDDWWDKNLFDVIICDVPCSATGIIRRQPDVKYIRTYQEVSDLVQLQKRILQNCWKMLRPQGVLIYTTCSVLKRENENQINDFISQKSDVINIKVNLLNSQQLLYGTQILPNDQDGFYYSLLQKK